MMTEIADARNLKPCPDCGGPAEYRPAPMGCITVGCTRCECKVSQPRGTLAGITEAWNGYPRAAAATTMDAATRRDMDWLMSHYGLPAADDREIRRLIFLGPVSLEGYCVAVLAFRLKAAVKLTGASLGDIVGLAAASDPSAL